MVEQPNVTVEPQPSVLYESRDVKARNIVAAVVVIGLALATVVGVARLFLEERRATSAVHAHRPFESAVPNTLPPAPLLEGIESPAPSDSSFADSEREREARLRGSGPADEPGFVHVPIEKAMEKVAKDLQPHTAPAPRQSKSMGLLGGGEASSGRVFRKDLQ
jgi:hypothetical protein